MPDKRKASPIKQPASKKQVSETTDIKSNNTSIPKNEKKPLHPFFDKFGKRDSNGNINKKVISWKFIGNEETVLVGTTPDFDSKNLSKVKAFDLDNTLITTKGKHVFPKNENDWEWTYKKVPEILAKHHKEGSKIIIFTNQAGLDYGKKDWEKRRKEFKTKLGYISNLLDVPFMIFAAMSKGYYRKPCTGLWDLFKQEIGAEPEIEKSIYVGDAAGRTLELGSKIVDHTDTDRKFAFNLNMSFQTPEEFFLETKPEPFSLSGASPLEVLKKIKDGTTKAPSVSPASEGKLELVLMVGPPGSGKTSVAKNYLLPFGYEWINNDTLKSKGKCLKLCESSLSAKKSVVIDNINGDKSARGSYIAIAKKYKAHVRCLLMDVDVDLSIHNAYFRSFRTPDSFKERAAIPTLVYRMHTKSYQPPENSEGIDTIEKVPFFPVIYQPDSKVSEAEKEQWEKEWTRFYS